jgi:hypothetical protein
MRLPPKSMKTPPRAIYYLAVTRPGGILLIAFPKAFSKGGTDKNDRLTWCVYYPVTAVSWTPDCPWHAIRWGTTDRSRFVAHSSWPSHETVHLENSSARVPYRTPCAMSARPTWKTKREKRNEKCNENDWRTLENSKMERRIVITSVIHYDNFAVNRLLQRSSLSIRRRIRDFRF